MVMSGSSSGMEGMDKAMDQLCGQDPADETTSRNERGITFVKHRSEAPGFPKGWYREEVIRSGAAVMNPSQKIVYYYSPDGRKFQSKADLTRFFGSRMDLTNFDFKSGKILPSYGGAKRPGPGPIKGGPITRNGAGNSLSPANLQRFLDSPVRQCTCIYNQKVKVVETCGKNVCKDVKDIPKNVAVALPKNIRPKPVQVFWPKRLEDCEAHDVDMDVKEIQELPKGFKAATSIISDSTAIASLAAVIHNSLTNQSYVGSDNTQIVGQTVPPEKIKQNPGVHITPYQPLTLANKVTPQQIEEQELQVQRLRQDLASMLLKQQKERSQ